MNFTSSLPVLYQLPVIHANYRLKARLDVIRGVSLAGEQLLCGRRAVPNQGKEEAEGEEDSILSDKAGAFPVCFQFVSNWGRGEFHL